MYVYLQNKGRVPEEEKNECKKTGLNQQNTHADKIYESNERHPETP